jgi:hypothetical protein
MSASGRKPGDCATVTVCTRRSFLLGALAGVAGAGILGCTGPEDSGSALQKWSAWLLGGDPASRDAAVRLGMAYLRAYPAEGDRRALLVAIDRVISANLESGDLASADAPQVGAALERAVRAEYAAGKVVMVEGWVLSVTEARLYAAVASA